MKESIRHLKQFSVILLLCYIAVLLINYEYTMKLNGFGFLKQFASVFTYTFGIYLANTLVLSDYYLKRKKNLENILIGGILVNTLTAFVVIVLEFLAHIIFAQKTPIEAIEFIKNNSLVMLWFSMTIATTVYIILLIRRKDKIEIIQQTRIATKATASFETLKNQLDPHFLFNSLNVLSALIEENPEKAQEFTISLSKIYRYVLDQKDKSLITVEEEIRFAKLYVSLLKMRFENGLNVNFPSENDLFQYQMIPLSLQLLLENAIKHNIVSDHKPLQIDLFFEEHQLIVRNNYQKKQNIKQSNGVGLKNIAQRYQLLSKEKMKIEADNLFFRVELPLLLPDIKIALLHQEVEKEIFEAAYKHMTKLKEFYVSVVLFLLMMPLFIAYNLYTYPKFQWWYFVAFSWIIGLIINGFQVINPLKKWEQKMYKKYLNEK